MTSTFVARCVVALGACSAISAQAQTTSDTAAIRKLYREWPRSVEAGSVSDYIRFLDDSITLLIPGAPAIRGVAAYREALNPMFQAARYRVSLSPPQLLQVAGIWAFTHYEGAVTTLPKAPGDSSIARNRYVDILRRQNDGTWRVFLHSWQASPASP